MLKFVAEKVITDLTDPTNPKEYIVPDMVKLINASLSKGDLVHIPVSIKNNMINFWEAGGRNPKAFISTANLIATETDSIPEAILFNKLNKNPNGKHALISIKPGYRLYLGKVYMRNSLAPKTKVVRLIFKGLDTESSTEITSYGAFVVDQIFTSYEEMGDSKPATRLLAKLFATKVMRPYFANGWSVSNVSGVTNKRRLKDEYIRIASEFVKIDHFAVADDFLDNVEDIIVERENPRLSSALQVIDFNTNMVTIRPLADLQLSDITGTLSEATSVGGFSIHMNDLIKCYNPSILFGNTDHSMIEIALNRDIANEGEFATELGSRVFAVLRGYRG